METAGGMEPVSDLGSISGVCTMTGLESTNGMETMSDLGINKWGLHNHWVGDSRWDGANE